MVDFLLYYSLAGVAWGIWVEILQRKGTLARLGVVIFFPFIATTLIWEVIRGK